MKKLLFVCCFLAGLSVMSYAQTATVTQQEPAKTAQEHKDGKACCKKGDAKAAAACSEHKGAKTAKSSCCKKGGQASASTDATPAAEQEKPCSDAGKSCCKKGSSAKASCQKPCCKSAKAATPEPAATPSN